MQVRHIRTRVVASVIAVMSAAAVMRGAADVRSPSLPAEIAIDHSILERAGPRLPLLPSHRTVLGAAQAGAGAAVPATLLAEQVFKNVQALKGISASDFMGTMGVMSASLGFDCSECHNAAGTDKVDWAADTPRKVIARRMVNMVTAINRDNFGGRQMVTCWSCHRNRDKPVVTPNLDYVYGMPNLEPDDLVLASVPGLKKADEILDRYLQAIGGTQRLAGITSITATGTSVGFGGFGGGGAVQFYAKAPDQRTTIIEFKDAPGRDASTRAFDGTTGWIKTPLTVLGEYQLSGNELDGAKLDAQLTFPGQIKQVLTNLRTLQPATIDDKECDTVQGNGPGRVFVTMYFDSQTGYLVRTVRYAASPIGRMPTQVDYGDYRDVNGVKIPFKYTFAWLDGRDAFQLNSVRVNLPIDSAKFAKPSASGVK
jgi:photosynthetic reaction center cytochrome c subunit